MKRLADGDTQPMKTIESTDPGEAPTFDPSDPPPAPTEAQVQAADRLLAAFNRPPTRIVPYQVQRASSDGAGAAAYSSVGRPAAANSVEHPQENVLVELAELARAARQAPRESGSHLVTTAPPLVLPRSRRHALLVLAVGLLATLAAVAGILFALREQPTPSPPPTAAIQLPVLPPAPVPSPPESAAAVAATSPSPAPMPVPPSPKTASPVEPALPPIQPPKRGTPPASSPPSSRVPKYGPSESQ
jgi:hypothetical protein